MIVVVLGWAFIAVIIIAAIIGIIWIASHRYLSKAKADGTFKFEKK